MKKINSYVVLLCICKKENIKDRLGKVVQTFSFPPDSDWDNFHLRLTDVYIFSPHTSFLKVIKNIDNAQSSAFLLSSRAFLQSDDINSASYT